MVFRTSYLEKERGDPLIFWAFLAQVGNYLTAVKVIKKSDNGKIFTQTSLNAAHAVHVDLVILQMTEPKILKDIANLTKTSFQNYTTISELYSI